ncbi:MAG: hypothetical protein KIS78_29340, partial [Labilithrix sp.]|nr:hypothetical protein [Labilithrix sp.]
EGHSDDAAMLFAVTADDSDFADVDAAVERDLDFRAELFDEWMAAINGSVHPRLGLSERPPRRVSERPARMPSTRPGAHRPSARPPA